MKKYLVLAILISASAQAQDLPVSKAGDQPEAFNTRDEAAKAAFTVALPLSVGVEYGGAILQCGENFIFTEAVTLNHHSDVMFKIGRPVTCVVAGLYHTHPKTDTGFKDSDNNLNRQSTYFSPADIEIAKKLNLASYIGVQTDNTIRVFIPGKTPQTVQSFTGYSGLTRISSGEIL